MEAENNDVYVQLILRQVDTPFSFQSIMISVESVSSSSTFYPLSSIGKLLF